MKTEEQSANANLGPVSFDMHAGLEYSFRDLISIRTGYNDLGNLTLGAGVKLPKINIDYSFSKFDGLEELETVMSFLLSLHLKKKNFRENKILNLIFSRTLLKFLARFFYLFKLQVFIYHSKSVGRNLCTMAWE